MPPRKQIEVRDSDGRTMLMPREEWAEKILPDMLKSGWDDADKLFRFISYALSEGFSSELVAAAERLVHIDRKFDRGACVMAAVQLESGKPDEAQKTLQLEMAKSGETPALLANLARIHVARGDQPRAEELLRRSLALDVNSDFAIGQLARLAGARGGAAAQRALLEELARTPGSFVARLFLARAHLDAGETASAIALYQEVLTMAPADADVLLAITSDLGSRGFEREAVELVEPIFNEKTHGVQPGMNLARALLGTGKVHEGKKLVNRLQDLQSSEFNESLAALEREFIAAQLVTI